MIGGLFAGHDQCGGEIIEKGNKKYKLFYGMSSDTAMKKHHGSVAEYRASEGKTTTIPYRFAFNFNFDFIINLIFNLFIFKIKRRY